MKGFVLILEYIITLYIVARVFNHRKVPVTPTTITIFLSIPIVLAWVVLVLLFL